MEIKRINNPTLDQLETGDEVHVKPVTIMRIEGDHVWCKLFSGQEVPVEASHIEYVTREAPQAAVGDLCQYNNFERELLAHGEDWSLWRERGGRTLFAATASLAVAAASPGFRIVRRAPPAEGVGRPYQ
jgi:hypothetical protein